MSSIYNIKLCETNDIDKVKHFINTHWKKNHALVLSHQLIDFQHYEANNNTYNFVIAVNAISNEIDGLIGFISPSHYDSKLSAEKDFWGAIWKIRDDVENEEIKTLGLYLFERFQEIASFKTFGAIGISSIAKKIYKALRYTTGELNQFYVINESIDEFKIAQVNKTAIPIHSNKYSAIKISEIIDLANLNEIKCFYSPKKSVQYLINRYQNHPIYHYNFWAIHSDDKIKTILVVRTHSLNNAKIIRIVDLLGEHENLPYLYDELQFILKSENAEYIDCLNFGIGEDVFINAGFSKLDLEAHDTIIPTYFEPFEKKNVKIEFAYKSANPYMIFKGDSDQDRPNIIYS